MSLPGLVIVGAGGLGREVYSWAKQSLQFEREWYIKGFLDDNLGALSRSRCPGLILGSISSYMPRTDEVYVCAIGSPALRRKIYLELEGRGAIFVSVIHRTVVIGDGAALGSGLILCPYAVISVDCRLGRGVIVNLQSSIDHDAVVGEWSQISCNCDITGGVSIGSSVFLGSSVCILPNVCVGDNSVVGAGAVVVHNVPSGATVKGVPARTHFVERRS